METRKNSFGNKIGGVRNKRKIPGFTIFEVTVVLAIMGTIVSLIMIASLRFNEQLKQTSVIRQELNTFFAFRSNLWDEFYHLDSVKTVGNELQLFSDKREISYRINDQSLERFHRGAWRATDLSAERIRVEESDGTQEIVFDFLWKGSIMTMRYFFKPDARNSINDYFAEYE